MDGRVCWVAGSRRRRVASEKPAHTSPDRKPATPSTSLPRLDRLDDQANPIKHTHPSLPPFAELACVKAYTQDAGRRAEAARIRNREYCSRPHHRRRHFAPAITTCRSNRARSVSLWCRCWPR
jgi:hypothetical protein